MDKLDLLHCAPAFSGLDRTQLGLLASSVGSQSFERGEVLFHQGSIGSVLYIVVSGQVRIYTVSEGGQELTLAICKEGEFLGELALLDGLPRWATPRALRQTTPLTFPRSAFLHTTAACPPIAAAVLEAVAARLRQANVYAEQLSSLS